MSKYLEQYERMQRAYKKYEDLAQNGRQEDVASVDYEDNIYAFFMHCYHLKDWIKNDVGVSRDIKKQVETFIKGDDYLRICADVCNSMKHLTLDRPPRAGEAQPFGRRKAYGLFASPTQPIAREQWMIIRKANSPIDAFEVACKCVEAWGQFLVSKHLIKAP